MSVKTNSKTTTAKQAMTYKDALAAEKETRTTRSSPVVSSDPDVQFELAVTDSAASFGISVVTAHPELEQTQTKQASVTEAVGSTAQNRPQTGRTIIDPAENTNTRISAKPKNASQAFSEILYQLINTEGTTTNDVEAALTKLNQSQINELPYMIKSLTDIQTNASGASFKMNYELIAAVDVFMGYTVEQDLMQIKEEIWTPLTISLFLNNTKGLLLCRVKKYMNKLIGIKQSNRYNLDVYNEYFLLSPREYEAPEQLPPVTIDPMSALPPVSGGRVAPTSAPAVVGEVTIVVPPPPVDPLTGEVQTGRRGAPATAPVVIYVEPPVEVDPLTGEAQTGRRSAPTTAPGSPTQTTPRFVIGTKETQNTSPTTDAGKMAQEARFYESQQSTAESFFTQRTSAESVDPTRATSLSLNSQTNSGRTNPSGLAVDTSNPSDVDLLAGIISEAQEIGQASAAFSPQLQNQGPPSAAPRTDLRRGK